LFLTEGKTCCYIHQTLLLGFPIGRSFTSSTTRQHSLALFIIAPSTAFSLLANSNPEVDESQEMEPTIESLSFYFGPSGSTHLSDPTKLGPLASKTERITISGSSVGSSSEVNSPVSLTATENMQKGLK
jgi:hypothetical protein